MVASLRMDRRIGNRAGPQPAFPRVPIANSYRLERLRGCNNFSASPTTQTTLHRIRRLTDDARTLSAIGMRRIGMCIRLMAAAAGAGAIFSVAGAFASDNGGLEEIVVTAQRREESAQNVGIAMSVLSGQSLADKSISYVNDLQNAVPNLQVEPAFGSSQPQFRLRGVGFIDYTSNNTAPVGVSLDGVAFALPIQTQGQLFDIDRVEVLRGPQGTLYGRNTTGGEINFISNRPTADPHAEVSLEYGSHNELNAQGFVSGGIAEGLMGRVSVATEQGGAWQRNRVTGQSLGDKDKVA